MPEVRKPKVLVVACADSPLLRDRARIPLSGEYETLWFSESAQAPDAPAADCRVVHAPIYPALGEFSRLLTVFRFLLCWLFYRPDILHIHWAVFPSLLLGLPWRNVVVSPMGSDIFLPGRFSFRQRISRKVLSRAAVVTSKSEFMDQQLLSLGIPAERILRITWGVDDAYFTARSGSSELRNRMAITPETLVFFSPRAMKPLYRIDAIIRAFARYRTGGGGGLLLISEMSGSAAERERLLSLLDDVEVRADVRFLGQLDANAMREHYAVADAVISYAVSDGLPQTLYEAMAVGCYPIFTDLPQYHKLITTIEDGYLCDSTDESRLVAAMQYVADKVHGQWSPEVNRQRVRNIASRNVETEKMLDCYQQLLTSGSHQS